MVLLRRLGLGVVLLLLTLSLAAEARAVTTAGLVGYYSFNAGDARDDSGHGNAGAVTGAPTYLPTGGYDGSGAYTFPAQGDWLTVDASASAVAVNTAAGGSNTVTFWMYWNGTSGQMPFSWEGIYYDFYLAYGWAGFNTGAGDSWGRPNTGLSGRWVHVAAVFYNGVPASGGEIYVDGVAQALSYANANAGSSRIATPSFRLSGWSSDLTHGFVGSSIDELRVYNRALTSAEIGEIYAFDSVPEPGALALGVAGLAGLRLARRRVRAR